MKLKNINAFLVLSLILNYALSPAMLSAEDNRDSLSRPIYDEQADGFKQVDQAVALARKEHKRVLLDFGYNGCIWCRRLHNLFESDKSISERLKRDYIVVYIDWSKRHNVEVDAKYQARTLYGAPSLVVLDSNGARLTTKDTGELEENDHHSPQKVLAFLKEWAPGK